MSETKDAAYAELAELGKAFGNARRLELLDLLCQGPRTVEDLATRTRQSVASASHHLRKLRVAGLVGSDKDGLHVTYRLADDAVVPLVARLKDLARRRRAELDRIERELEGAEDLEPLDARELKRRMRAGDVVLLDVRPELEYRAGHLPGARSVPLDELERRLDELPDDVELVAYCRGPWCTMARQAVSRLRREGRAARLCRAGVSEWRAAGGRLRAGR